MKHTRRQFIQQTGTAAAAVTGLTAFAASPEPGKKPVFIHHVFFWLKEPASTAARDKLVEGLQALSKVKTIRRFYIGKPADTNRDVIERGYAVSWCVFFDNDADQASYQTDPIHLQFVKDYAHLWSKVIVYDAVDL